MQVKLLKIAAGVVSQLNELNDSASIHSLGLGVSSNFTDGYSLSIINSTGAPTTLSTGAIIYSNSGSLKIKQADGNILGGFLAGGDLTGSSLSQTVSSLQGTVLNVTSLIDGYILTYDAGSSSFKLKSNVISLGGDASGTTVSVINNQARGLKTATTTVAVSTADAPTAGQVLTATSGSAATWQTTSLTRNFAFMGS